MKKAMLELCNKKEILQEFEDAGGRSSHSPQSESFFAKAKKLGEDAT